MAALAGLAAAGALLAGCGGSSAEPATLLEKRLAVLDLSVRWVRCVDSGLRFGGARSFRCTVNFGDPHLVPYCAAVLDGELVTDRERPDLRCYPPQEECRYLQAALLDPGPRCSRQRPGRRARASGTGSGSPRAARTSP